MNSGHAKLSDSESESLSSITSVRRAMRAIQELSSDPNGLTITDLSENIGVSKSMAHRLLASLATEGYVYQDALTRRYRLSTKLLGLAFRHLRVMKFYDLLLPILQRLSESVKCDSELNWIDNGRMVTVLKADSPNRVRVANYLGEEQHLHASACGKVWLAHLPEAEALRLVLDQGMEPLSERTITDLAEYREELAKVRTRGYGLNLQETGPEADAISAAALGPGGTVLGAVSVLAPSFREIHSDERVIGEVISAATEISSVWPYVDREL